MHLQHRLRIALVIMALYCSTSLAMIYDNRYFPWYNTTILRTDERPSNIVPYYFMVTAHDAFHEDDKPSGIPDMLGIYEEQIVAQAVTKLGFTNPLVLSFQAEQLIWNMHGKIEGQGFSIFYEQYLGNNLWMGASFFAMHLLTKHEFELNQKVIDRLALTAEDIDYLDNVRREMNDMLKLAVPVDNVNGVSDVDCYLRYGYLNEYVLKCRRIDVGVNLGLIVPTGKKRSINNPASIPLGGNGHWGIYASFDGQFELKEDLIAGVLLRVNQRFNHVEQQRVPLAQEQQLYAAQFAQVKVKPGLTGIFSPYLQLNNIRDGLGMQVKFTGVWHDNDLWRLVDKSLVSVVNNLKQIQRNSSWSSEYITITGLYDFNALKCYSWSLPTFSIMWDIPVQFFGTAERAAKTNRISVGLVVNF